VGATPGPAPRGAVAVTGLAATAVLALVAAGLVALIAARPMLAVREDRALAAEERGWLDAGRFPVRVRRIYRHSRVILTDSARLFELGYRLSERRRARGSWGRVSVVVWDASGPPARPAGEPDAAPPGSEGSG
jgi:hypothetical protein